MNLHRNILLPRIPPPNSLPFVSSSRTSSVPPPHSLSITGFLCCPFTLTVVRKSPFPPFLRIQPQFLSHAENSGSFILLFFLFPFRFFFFLIFSLLFPDFQLYLILPFCLFADGTGLTSPLRLPPHHPKHCGMPLRFGSFLTSCSPH